MGDGINDASALHAADVGISVDSGADVAKMQRMLFYLKKTLAFLWMVYMKGDEHLTIR